MRNLGIDIGSRDVKIVLMEDGEILQKIKMSTMTFYRDFCSFTGKVTVHLDRLNMTNIQCAVSTGYARNKTRLKDFKAINEIEAHIYGAVYQTGLENFILLDIGGQDVKVAKIENGVLSAFEMNEKCAASSGRYLENMASVLEITIHEMFQYYKNPTPLNFTCAVFSESELINKIAEGAALPELCAGVNYSLYRNLQPLLKNFPGDKLILSGGVAKNEALKRFLKNDYAEVIPLQNAQFNGAIGCCCYGKNEIGLLQI